MTTYQITLTTSRDPDDIRFLAATTYLIRATNPGAAINRAIKQHRKAKPGLRANLWKVTCAKIGGRG